MQTPKFLALPSSHSPAPPRHGLSLKRILASFCFRQPCGSGERHKSPVATAAAPCIAITALLIIAIIIIFIVQHLAALASPGGDLLPGSPPPKKNPSPTPRRRPRSQRSPQTLGRTNLTPKLRGAAEFHQHKRFLPPTSSPPALQTRGSAAPVPPPGPRKVGFLWGGGLRGAKRSRRAGGRKSISYWKSRDCRRGRGGGETMTMLKRFISINWHLIVKHVNQRQALLSFCLGLCPPRLQLA